MSSGVVPFLAGLFREARLLIPEVVTAYNQLKGEKTVAAPPAAVRTEEPEGQVVTLMDRVKEVFVIGMDQCQKRVNGAAYAEYVCTVHPDGMPVWDFLKTRGTQGVFDLVAIDPDGAKFVNDPKIRPYVQKFLDEFFTYSPASGSGVTV